MEASKFPMRFSLTAAHYPDPTPSNCDRNNLIALCTVCHLRLNAVQHAISRKHNKRIALEKQGQQQLVL